jgi:DNA-directed RNA polymerase subunit beta'
VSLSGGQFPPRNGGLELLVPYQGEGVTIQPTESFTVGQLVHITRQAPRPIVVRDTETLATLKDVAYLAEDIVHEGEVVLSADSLLSEENVRILRKASVETIRIWRNPKKSFCLRQCRITC